MHDWTVCELGVKLQLFNQRSDCPRCYWSGNDQRISPRFARQATEPCLIHKCLLLCVGFLQIFGLLGVEACSDVPCAWPVHDCHLSAREPASQCFLLIITESKLELAIGLPRPLVVVLVEHVVVEIAIAHGVYFSIGH